MLRLDTLMNTGWKMVQSTISTIGEALFSASPKKPPTRQPMGLNDLILTKGYWVDCQRSSFKRLHESKLDAEILQSELDELLGQLGARLGSPAVMLLELAALREAIHDPKQLEIIHAANVGVQASMIKDPQVTYANLMADIQLLLEDTSIQFINSTEGRAWLEAYRPFFSNAVFEKAMIRIVDHAHAELGELYCHLKARRLSPEHIAAKMGQAQARVDKFQDWIEQLRVQRRQSIEPKAKGILLSWSDELGLCKEAELAETEPMTSSFGTWHTIRSLVVRLVKSTSSFVSQYQLVALGMLFVPRSVMVMADEAGRQGGFRQTRRGTDVFRSRKLNTTDFRMRTGDDKFFSFNDVTNAHQSRKLADETIECVNRIEEPHGWMLTLGMRPGWSEPNAMAVGAAGQVVVADYDGFLAQISADGNLEWVRRVEVSGRRVNFEDCVLSPSGQVIGVGTSYEGDNDIVLAQLDSTGNLVWVKTLGGYSDEYGYKVALAPSGKIVVMGELPIGYYGSSEILLALVGSGVSIEWAQTLAGSASDNAAHISIGQSGQIIFLGRGAYGSSSPGETTLVQVGENGEVEWSHTLYWYDSLYAQDIVISQTGHIIAVGSDYSDVMLAQFDATGNFEWARHYDGSNFYGWSSDVAISESGQLFLVASGHSNFLWASVSTEGEVEWATTIRDSRIGGEKSFIAVGPTGQIVLSGRIESSGGFNTFVFSTTTLKAGLEITSINLSFQEEALATETNEVQPYFHEVFPVSFNQATVDYIDLTSSSDESALSVPSSFYSAMIRRELYGIQQPVFEQEFILPLAGLFFSASAVVGADLANIDWMSFDFENQQLVGTPTQVSLGQLEVPLTIELKDDPGTAVVSLKLCVSAFGSLSSDKVSVFGSFAGDTGQGIALGPSGQVALIGTSEAYGANSTNVLIAQYDHLGSLQWVISLTGDSGFGGDVAIGPANQIIIVGTTAKRAGGGEGVFLAHVNAAGDLEWMQALDGDGDDHGKAIAIAPSGHILLVGESTSGGQDSKDVLLAQFGMSGDPEWTRIFGGLDEDYARGITTSTTGQIVLVGSTRSYGAGSVDVLIASCNASGNFEWIEAIGVSGDDYGQGVAISESGQIVVVGSTQSNGNGAADVLLAQLDPLGNLRWAKILRGDAEDYGYGIAIRPSNQIVLVGKTNSYGEGAYDLLLAQVDSVGGLDWAWTLGGIGDDCGNNIITGPSGKSFLVGATSSHNAGSEDVLIARLDTAGQFKAMPGYLIQSFSSIQSLPFLPEIERFNVTERTLTKTYTNVSEAVEVQVLSLMPTRYALPFNRPFTIDFKNYINSPKLVFSLSVSNHETLPKWLDFNWDNLVLSGTPIGDARGHYIVRMYVLQGDGRHWISIGLDVLNSAPCYIGSDDFESAIGRFVFPIGSSFADQDDDPIRLFRIGDINGTQAAPLASIDPDTGRFFGTTLSGDQGSYQFNITAADPFGGLGWQIINLNILNRSPVRAFSFEYTKLITIGSEPLHYDFPSNAFVDPDGDTVSYETIVPYFLSFDPASRLISGSPGNGDAGQHEAFIIARDPYGGSSNVSIIVDVNAEPVLSGQLSQITTSLVNHYFERSLESGLFVDPDGDDLTYALIEDIQHITPNWLSFNSVNRTLSGVPTSNPHQAQSLRFEVNDGRGGSAFFDLDLVVPNSSPRLAGFIQNETVAANQIKSTVVPSGTFLEPDGDEVTYRLLGSDSHAPPGFATISANSMTFAPRSGDQGIYHMRLTAADPFELSANVSFTVMVGNRLPILLEALPATAIVTEGNAFFYTFPTTTFSDPDGDILRYSATAPEFLTFDASSRSFRGVPGAVDIGQHNLMIIASDGYGGQNSQIIPIVVNGNPVKLSDL